MVVVLAIALDAFVMRLRGFRVGLDVIVRCQTGHLYTTIWLPGGSLKSVRLGLRRFQYCPVGRHWSLVSPVREGELTPEQRQTARQQHDIRIP